MENKMHKYQEALITLDELLRSCYDMLELKFPLRASAQIKLLQELADKETPQSLAYISTIGDSDGYPVYDVAICPSCDRKFEVEYEEHYNYCPNCGQKLNWGTANGIENNIVINDINEFNKM